MLVWRVQLVVGDVYICATVQSTVTTSSDQNCLPTALLFGVLMHCTSVLSCTYFWVGAAAGTVHGHAPPVVKVKVVVEAGKLVVTCVACVHTGSCRGWIPWGETSFILRFCEWGLTATITIQQRLPARWAQPDMPCAHNG